MFILWWFNILQNNYIWRKKYSGFISIFQGNLRKLWICVSYLIVLVEFQVITRWIVDYFYWFLKIHHPTIYLWLERKTKKFQGLKCYNKKSYFKVESFGRNPVTKPQGNVYDYEREREREREREIVVINNFMKII